MESLGQKFKTAREERGFTIDQVARDTHIAKSYIAALEEENFERFPGDTYIMGFIRNYADYLGLEPSELVSLYKNLKIQEQPIPLEKLLQKKSTNPLVFIAAGLLILFGLAAGGYFLFFRNQERPLVQANAEKKEKPAEASTEAEVPARYTMGEEAVEQSFVQGDEIIVKRQEASYTIKIEKIEDEVFLLAPVENMNIREGEEAYLRLAPQGETLKVICRGIERGSRPKAVLFLDKYLPAPEEGTPAASTEAAAPTSAIGSTNEPSRVKRSRVILEAPSRQPFTIEVEFRGYCLLRYMTDNQTREERYFRRGETFRTDLRGEIRLWYSNSGSLRARISGNEIEFGKPGEVGASLIRWVQAEADRGYRLELIPMY
jgi:cytoskeletal protein RodZ